MNPLKAAAWNFWYTLSNAETLTIYQLAIAKTWKLLKQAVQLVLILILAVTTVAVWLWAVSFQSGRSLRGWLEIEQPTFPEILAAGWDLLIAPLKPAQKWAQAQLKTQFGLEVNLPAIPEFKALEAATPTATPPANATPTAAVPPSQAARSS